ncbi:Dimethlysulfonioproprionate lyase DddQ, partial [Clarias magur]
GRVDGFSPRATGASPGLSAIDASGSPSSHLLSRSYGKQDSSVRKWCCADVCVSQ